MLRNYFVVAWRNLFRHKLYSLANILGLALGMASCILVLLYVQDELSYDRYHEKAGRIYRIISPSRAKQPLPLASFLKDNFPEVISAVRIQTPYRPLMVHGDKRWYQSVHFVDAHIFEVFDIPFLRGDPATALKAPFTVVLAADIAEKYFGDRNPLGEVLSWDGTQDFEVTGVVDVPRNTHFHFDILASYATEAQAGFANSGDEDDWEHGFFNSKYTYLLLATDGRPDGFEQRALDLLEKRVGGEVREEIEHQGGFLLQPLKNIHLRSHLPDELEPNGDINAVYITLSIAFFILLIACINSTNLSTARSFRRSREVGMRRVIGAQRTQLIQQFLGESILLSTVALIVALGLVECSLPAFNAFMGKELALRFDENLWLIPGLIGLTVTVGILAGSYPAFFLSSFRAAGVLKGEGRSGSKGAFLRRGLVVFQFAMAVVLLIATGVAYDQLNYMRDKKLGLRKDQVVVLSIRYPGVHARMATVRQALVQHSGIEEVASFGALPSSRLVSHHVVRPAGAVEWTTLPYVNVEPGFIELFEMKMIAGRSFSRDIESDKARDRKGGAILNRTAAEMLGFALPETAIGRRVYRQDGGEWHIIGIVEDFHFESLHRKIGPLLLEYDPGEWAFAYAGVRIRPDDVQGTLTFIKDTWERFVPEFPATYWFLDESFAQLYRAEERLGKLVAGIALLAIFVSCLGLFGLTAFTTEQRTKEIGIRKVLGASVPGIVSLLSREYTWLVLAANAMAWPSAWYAMSGWLEGFAYRIELRPELFIQGGLLTLTITWLTVSYQSIRAAFANPIDALRYE